MATLKEVSASVQLVSQVGLERALYTKTEVNGLLPIYAEEQDIDEMFD